MSFPASSRLLAQINLTLPEERILEQIAGLTREGYRVQLLRVTPANSDTRFLYHLAGRGADTFAHEKHVHDALDGLLAPVTVDSIAFDPGTYAWTARLGFDTTRTVLLTGGREQYFL